MKFLVVTLAEEGMTLLSFLKTKLKAYPSVKAIKRAIDRKQCSINGQVETFSTHRVEVGEVIAISLEVEPQVSVQLLYEDEFLIVYNKSPRVSSEKLCSFFPVHRLDKETSGVILFAKTAEVQKLIEDLFRTRRIEKTYIAICDGPIVEPSWTVNNFLKPKVRYQGGLLMGKTNSSQGKRAITHFKVIKATEKATLVMARPITGRTHQIRVHLNGMGHPILGDWQYGKQFACPLRPKRQMLHALRLSFLHPVTGEPFKVEAPLLKDFLQVQKSLFRH